MSSAVVLAIVLLRCRFFGILTPMTPWINHSLLKVPITARRGFFLCALTVFFLSGCQKKSVQHMPSVSLPAGVPFVLFQPQPPVQHPKPNENGPRPYIGILTAIVASPGRLVVSGFQGTILLYSNSTRRWIREEPSLHGDFYGLAVSATNVLWVAGDKGVLLRSRDGGVHWSPVTSGVAPLFLNALSFPTPSIGYAVGEKGTILKTGDGGDHWSRIPSPTRENLYGVAFSDARHGVISGWHRTLLTTSDGGEHLRSVTLPIQKVSRQEPSFNSVWSRGDRYLVAGDHGFLFQSTDGGQSFSPIETGALKDFYGVCQTGKGEIALAGEEGLLLFLSTGPDGWKRSTPLGDFHGVDWLGISCGKGHVRVVGSKGSILLPAGDAKTPVN